MNLSRSRRSQSYMAILILLALLALHHRSTAQTSTNNSISNALFFSAFSGSGYSLSFQPESAASLLQNFQVSSFESTDSPQFFFGIRSGYNFGEYIGAGVELSYMQQNPRFASQELTVVNIQEIPTQATIRHTLTLSSDYYSARTFFSVLPFSFLSFDIGLSALFPSKRQLLHIQEVVSPPIAVGLELTNNMTINSLATTTGFSGDIALRAFLPINASQTLSLSPEIRFSRIFSSPYLELDHTWSGVAGAVGVSYFLPLSSTSNLQPSLWAPDSTVVQRDTVFSVSVSVQEPTVVSTPEVLIATDTIVQISGENQRILRYKQTVMKTIPKRKALLSADLSAAFITEDGQEKQETALELYWTQDAHVFFLHWIDFRKNATPLSSLQNKYRNAVISGLRKIRKQQQNLTLKTDVLNQKSARLAAEYLPEFVDAEKTTFNSNLPDSSVAFTLASRTPIEVLDTTLKISPQWLKLYPKAASSVGIAHWEIIVNTESGTPLFHKTGKSDIPNHITINLNDDISHEQLENMTQFNARIILKDYEGNEFKSEPIVFNAKVPTKSNRFYSKNQVSFLYLPCETIHCDALQFEKQIISHLKPIAKSTLSAYVHTEYAEILQNRIFQKIGFRKIHIDASSALQRLSALQPYPTIVVQTQ